MMGNVSVPLQRRRDKPVIFEGGHFYEAKGPTRWTQIGWNILTSQAIDGDGRMLFIDDVHSIEQLDFRESDLQTIEFCPQPCPTITCTESMMREKGLTILEELKKLPRRKRARATNARVWQCSGFPLTNPVGEPLCLLYDLALTRYKYELGFIHAVNIVPSFYERQQRRLLRLAAKAVPELRLQVVLFELDGSVRVL